MVTATNAPPEQPVDSIGQKTIITILLHQADRILLGGFVINDHSYNAWFFEKRIYQIMMMRNNDEALQLLLQEGDFDLEQMVFADGTEPLAFDDDELVVAYESTAKFKLKWINMLFNVFNHESRRQS